MKKFTPLEQTQETAKMFEQQPETERKIAYYKGVLQANANLINSISDRIKKGYTAEKYLILGINITKKIVLDSYAISKLEVEKLEVEYQIESQKNYFETYLGRSKEYEKKFQFYLQECNSRFDEIFEDAKKVAELGNIRLASVLAKFDPKCETKVKVEAYLYFKQEVENHYKHGKQKLSSVNVDHQPQMEAVK